MLSISKKTWVFNSKELKKKKKRLKDFCSFEGCRRCKVNFNQDLPISISTQHVISHIVTVEKMTDWRK